MSSAVVASAVAGCAADPAVPEDPTGAAQRGLEIAKSSGCAGCHGSSFDGAIGPSWVGLYGSQVEISGNGKVFADDAYLFESIRDPEAKKVKGATGVLMPSNTLTDDEINDVIAYIKTLAKG
ncbi:MAG: cytochrome c family protein [Acidimicrobiia bacterium]